MVALEFSLVPTIYAVIYSIAIIGPNSVARCSGACVANPVCGGFSFQDEVCRIVVYSEDGSGPREVTANVFRRTTYRNKRILDSGGGNMVQSDAKAACNNIGGSLFLPPTTLLEKSIQLIRDRENVFVDVIRVGVTDIWKDSFANEYHTTDSFFNWAPNSPNTKNCVVYVDDFIAYDMWETSVSFVSGLCLEN